MPLWLVPVIAVNVAVPPAATAPAAVVPIRRDQLAVQINRLLQDPALKGAVVGIVVRSLSTGETLFSHNPNRRCIPASNQKLITAAAAISLLGPSFRFTTDLRRKGDQLWLVGSGDPSLDRPRLAKLAGDAMSATGPDRPIVLELDDTAFAGPSLGAAWQWDDESFSFSAPFSALVADRSTASLSIVPNIAGTRAAVAVDTDGFAVEGTVTTVEGNIVRVEWERERGTSKLRVSGTIGASAGRQSIAFAVDDSTRHAGAVFVGAAQSLGWPLAVGGRSAVPGDGITVAASQSRPLADLLCDFLKPSDNLAGECLLRTIGRSAIAPGTARSGIARVHAWLESMGIDRKGIDIVDGSGLSMQNALTTGFVTDLLVGMRNNADFRKALPVAGRDGTLKGRMRGTPAEGRVLAKTGTLTVASSLSGYALTLGGEDIAFSILMNQFDRTSGARRAREIQDSIAQLLVRIAPPKR